MECVRGDGPEQRRLSERVLVHGFHPEGLGKDTTAVLNRERKAARVREGRAHAALVFEGDLCVGWCQFGSPDELPRIKSRAAYEKDATTLPDWRIACFYVRKGHRRRGVSRDALSGALTLVAELGGGYGVSEWTLTGTVPDGRRIEVNGCDFLTVRDGEIVTKNSYRKQRPPIGVTSDERQT